MNEHLRGLIIALSFGSSAVLGLACGDDTTADSGADSTSPMTSGTADGTTDGMTGGVTTGTTSAMTNGTTGGLATCEEALDAESCATAKFGFCSWVATSLVPADGSSCELNGRYGGVCIDFSTADGCHPGFCEMGTFALFYREVEGGYEVAQTTDCNPMTDEFEECPPMGTEAPPPCACACWGSESDTGTATGGTSTGV